jgi:hypothetical protein
MSSSQLRTIPRLPLPPLSKKAAKLFRTSPAEIELVTRLRAKIEPRQTVAMSALRGADAKLGIKLDEVGPGDYVHVFSKYFITTGCLKSAGSFKIHFFVVNTQTAELHYL